MAEEEVSSLQEIVFLTLRLPPPVVHFLTRTGADLAAALADSALAWNDLGLSFAYVCMYVCILQPKPTISQYQAAYLYTPRHQVTDVTSPHKRSHFQFYDTHKA